jgi:hypothetical protein
MKIAFQRRNTIQSSKTIPRNRYKKYAYQLKCISCPQKYIGQTGQTVYSPDN